MYKGMSNEDFVIATTKEVYKQLKQEQEKEEKKTLFRNTRKLMSNYHTFIDHCELNVSFSELNDYNPFEDLQEDIVINSMKKTKARTLLLVSCVEASINKIQMNAKMKNYYDKYKVFYSFYICEKTSKLPFNEKLAKIADEMNISESTVRRYECDMITELSAELFGIGAFKLLK